MSQLQISLAAMFVLTAAAAVSVFLFQTLGTFWLMVLGGVVACLRAPAWDGVNPLALATGYMLVAFIFTCGLCYAMDASPSQAAVPFFILPALAYIVGFFKGMENA